MQKQKPELPAYDASEVCAPIRTLRAAVGVGKSHMFRAKATKFLNSTPVEGCVVIAVDHHDLSSEQLDKFREEHPKTALVARIWRGRSAIDPEQEQPADPRKPRMLMCLRNADAEEVGKHGFSVEHCLCCYQDRETDEEIRCPHYDEDAPMPCGYQRQQRLHANIWFCAHETLLNAAPKVFGEVLMLFIDEDPLDAFLFGVDEKDYTSYTLKLDALAKPAHNIEGDDDRKKLMQGRHKLRRVLKKLRDGPIPVNALRDFNKEECDELLRLEWQNKITDVEIRPDMDSETIRGHLAPAEGNRHIKKLVTLWKLIGDALRQPVFDGEVWRLNIRPGELVKHDHVSGRMELATNDDSERVVRMKGISEIGGAFSNIPTIIGSATLDHDLLLPIWKEAKAYPDLAMRKPKHVRVTQVIDRSFGKSWIAPKDDEQKALERTQDVYAVCLREAKRFAPERSLVIVHGATEQVIRDNCFVPEWIELAHHGAVIGLDKWKDVRAVFIVGRPMPKAWDITKQAEALFGEHIADRDYVAKEVTIAIVPDAEGNNQVKLTELQHPDVMGERLRKRVVWGGVLQEAGRTRYLERTADKPLDIWLMNDVAVPELQPVVAVEAAEIAPSLDDLMWTRGVWLENAADAARAFPDLVVSEAALRMARSRRTVTNAYRYTPYREMLRSSSTTISYRRAAAGAKKSTMIVLTGALEEPEVWLISKLGALAHFKIEGA